MGLKLPETLLLDHLNYQAIVRMIYFNYVANSNNARWP